MTEVELVDFAAHPEWDSFVESHPHGWISHLSGWHDVLTANFRNLTGGILSVIENGRIIAGVPLYRKRSWLTKNRIVSIPFATIADFLVFKPSQAESLFNGALEILSRDGTDRYAEFRLFNSAENFEQTKAISRVIFKCHYIRLQPDFETIRRSFHRSCVRQRIDRAYKSGLRLKVAADGRDVDTFYWLYVETRRRLGLPPQPRSYIRSLWDTFSESGKIQILLAYKEATPVSALLLFRYKKRVSAEYACMSEAYRDFSPNHFLFWEAIKQACIDGFEVFDFGRTDVSNKSLMEFKSRWGTEVTDIVHLYYVPLNEMNHGGLEETGRGILGMICKAVPRKVLPEIGNILFQHAT